MFSFRRKPKKPEEPQPIRTSPSLPDFKNTVQGTIPWPEDLVDVAAIRKLEADEEVGSVVAMTEESYMGGEGRPSVVSSRYQGEAAISEDETKSPISSFYMSMATPPEALDHMRKKWYEKKEKTESVAGSRVGQRRAKVPPTFNIMVVGGKGTGKSSLLRLLLETSEVSPTATKEQRTAFEKFLNDATKSTQTIQGTSIEISESKFDRVMLSVIDTPGLDFQEGRELKLERQVNAIIRHVDAQYADTMSEESKVVRQRKGDQHVHLCIYMIDPASIISSETRRSLPSTPHPAPAKMRSEATISHSQPPDLVPDTSSGDESEDEEDEDEGPLTMAPAEIKVIRRIANRSNILPVIAHADSLTDEKLTAIKEAVRKGLSDAGFDLGVFGPIKKSTDFDTQETSVKPSDDPSNDSMNGHTEDGGTVEESDAEDTEEDGERQSRPVIKLRPPRHRNVSRSRSRRRELSRVAEDDRQPLVPDEADPESVANIRFSAHTFAKNDITSLLPFALIAPENKKRPRRQKTVASLDGPATPTGGSTAQTATATEDGHETRSSQMTDSGLSPVSPSSTRSHSAAKQSFVQGPPADMKGVFVRRFRWGTVDVLDPEHCDFAALRTAILSTHLKVLKVHTREVLYEKYRTEKLLARRATRQISEEERHRLLEDLGI
ncbi:Septin-9 [Leucoagaricus sp. SymC.cos]|nr:Septin-9 [Leucoagaricus sp. SymC.cos]